MNYYFLLLRNETIEFGSYTTEEMQRIMTEFDAWNAKMSGEGRLTIRTIVAGSNNTLAIVTQDLPTALINQPQPGNVNRR